LTSEWFASVDILGVTVEEVSPPAARSDYYPVVFVDHNDRLRVRLEGPTLQRWVTCRVERIW
jgi:hypothetical protein